MALVGSQKKAPGIDIASFIRVRDAVLRCHEYCMNADSAEEVLLDVARGDADACALLDMRLTDTEAKAAVMRMRADLALLAKEDRDNADLADLRDSTQCTSKDEYRSRLVEIYRHHNAQKLAGLDAVLQKYVGREAELYRKVCEKYDVVNKDCLIAVFDTSLGAFKAEIYLDRVPVTASNFVDLAQSGFYDGIHVHRVIPGVINQFGCPHARYPFSSRAGTGNPPDGTFQNLKTGVIERRFGGGNIQDEHISKDSNLPGTLSMANSGYPSSGGSQIFVNLRHNPSLDWFTPGPSKHPVFGRVVDGFEVCERINAVKTVDDKPVMPIVINSVSIAG